MVRAGYFTGGQGRWSENVLVQEGAGRFVQGDAGTGGRALTFLRKGESGIPSREQDVFFFSKG